ncbi:MAG: hypothetical protein MZV65_33000 [Chromatiales bacterium]|nr:hypothetical protein [Chromatiales bacterium]
MNAAPLPTDTPGGFPRGPSMTRWLDLRLRRRRHQRRARLPGGAVRGAAAQPRLGSMTSRSPACIRSRA